jgi:uncharacterized integral membrane protein
MAGRGQAGPPLICSGNAIDFRVGRGEAEAIKSVLVGLMLGKHPTQQVPTSTSSPPPPPPSPVSLVAASALVSAAALNELARMTVSGVSGRWRFGGRLGRQPCGAIVTPVGDDVERNVVGDSPGPSPETGLADERAATGQIYRGTTGVGVALVIGVAMTVLAIVLAAQNTDNTTVEVFAANYRAPLIVVILAAAITGVLLDEIFGFIWRRHRRHRLAERAELRRLRRTQ